MDSKFDDITDECIDEFFAEINCGSINYDDVLLSALVTLAPKHIYIHSVLKNKELSVTLKKIFNKRIVFCDSANYDNYSVQNAIIGVKEKNYGNISKLSILSQIKSDL